MQKLTFITGSQSKAEQLSHYLQMPIEHHKIDLVEIQAVDVSHVIIHKAKEGYNAIHSPVIVDDVSLTIHSMGKLPGAFIKFFIQEMGNATICRLAHALGDVSAQAKVAIGLYDGTNMHVFEGVIDGEIAIKPKGTHGFGWDEIFIPADHTKTRAEMEEAEYDETSPRRIALEKLASFLKTT